MRSLLNKPNTRIAYKQLNAEFEIGTLTLN